MYILRRLSVFFSSWANIDILHVDSGLLWIETWFIQPLGLVILAVVFLFFSSRAKVAVQMARWQSTSLQPRCGGRLILAIIHHQALKITPLHCSHTRSKSSRLILDCYQTALWVTRDHYTEAHVLRPEPWTHLGPGYTLTSRDRPGKKTFLYSKLTDARVTQNAPTAGQLQMPMHKNQCTALQWVAFGFNSAVGQNELILQ